MGYFEKTYHPPGTPPGTLVAYGDAISDGLSVRLIDYTSSEYSHKILERADECSNYVTKDSVTWIHLQGQIQADMILDIGNQFGLHPLAMEDILNTGQRSKIEEYEEQLFIIMSAPGNINNTTLEQISLFLGKNYIISICTGDSDPFEPLRSRLQKKVGRIRQKKADYLLYCILDLVIDMGFPLLESYGEVIEAIEDELLSSKTKQITLKKIHHIRRELLLLRRNLWPQRDIINSLLRDENELINEGTLLYLRDCYDHTIQIMELIETYRDMTTNMTDIYLSSSSHRLNEVMRILTIIATIFIPLTFVVGLYGMNFNHPESPWAMPELRWYYGYPLIWVIMISIVIGMITYFKKKHWF
ncbi:MAG: magnesium/cobalt transporter CorA [Gammaproteobacteria bacterium]|nr:magnesium/cobalt transporter CorA [Gammaproteobacteria bacterium]